jgi:SAM-dependent methyltransferase
MAGQDHDGIALAGRAKRIGGLDGGDRRGRRGAIRGGNGAADIERLAVAKALRDGTHRAPVHDKAVFIDAKAGVIDGDAQSLPFADNSFDVVCEFAILHHIPAPAKAVSEMLRVARRAVFVSDCNNFGQGSRLARGIKQAIHAVGLWPLANLIKTRGKGYSISEGDGLAYSYSLWDNYPQIAQACPNVHLIGTANSGSNLYRSAPHAAILGIKAPQTS